MCIGGTPKAPPPPPMPAAPPPDPKPVGEGVKETRAQDKQKAAYLASQGKRKDSGSAAAGLLTPASTSQTQGTLIGG